MHARGAAIFVHTAKQRQCHACLDVAVAVDGRRDGTNNTLRNLKNMMQIREKKTVRKNGCPRAPKTMIMKVSLGGMCTSKKEKENEEKFILKTDPVPGGPCQVLGFCACLPRTAKYYCCRGTSARSSPQSLH